MKSLLSGLGVLSILSELVLATIGGDFLRAQSQREIHEHPVQSRKETTLELICKACGFSKLSD